MRLQEKLISIKKDSIASRPPEVVEVLLGEVEKLIKSGMADKSIKPGKNMPEFSLPDEKGNLVSLKGLLSKGPLAVSFYRGIW